VRAPGNKIVAFIPSAVILNIIKVLWHYCAVQTVLDIVQIFAQNIETRSKAYAFPFSLHIHFAHSGETKISFIVLKQ
jgi:hypothetical protein